MHFSTFLSFQIALSASSILISTRNEENRDKRVHHDNSTVPAGVNELLKIDKANTAIFANV